MNKLMIVTGGGRGIGAAIARRAGAAGFNVAVNYSRSQQHALGVVADIRNAGGEAIAVQADISVEADIIAMFAEVKEKLGPVTALVNNAGIDRKCEFAEFEGADLQQLFATNSIGPMLCAREAVKVMSTNRGGNGGVIINVSSISSLYGGLPHGVAYAASKGAVDSFTLGLAREVADQGIRVCGVRPGITLTGMVEDPDATAEMARVGVPMGRMGQPEEIANAVLWLCTVEASYVTGSMLNVSGARELNVRST